LFGLEKILRNYIVQHITVISCADYEVQKAIHLKAFFLSPTL